MMEPQRYPRRASVPQAVLKNAVPVELRFSPTPWEKAMKLMQKFVLFVCETVSFPR